MAKQQVAPLACYETVTPSYSRVGGISFSDQQSFSELENKININMSESGGIWGFSENAMAKYMRSIKDTTTSVSVNYLQTILQEVSAPVYGLNQIGTTIYQAQKNGNSGAANFDMMCGNYYVNHYDRGALLLASFRIQFATAQEKQTLDEHASASFGGIFSAAESISEMASQYHLRGTVDLDALQVGGGPSQLAKTFWNNQTIASCTLKDMTACEDAAKSILGYAENNFSNQLSFNGATANGSFTPLPLNFGNDTASIADLGKTPLPTVITPAITQDRKQLATDLVKAKYYGSHYNALLNYYPVAWDKTSSLYGFIKNQDNLALKNQSLILQDPSNPTMAGIQCYNSPTLCPEITQNISQQYGTFSDPDTLELNFAEYTYSYYDQYFNGMLWEPAENSSATARSDSAYVISQGVFEAGSGSIRAVDYIHSSIDTDVTEYFNATSSDGGATYNGTASTPSTGWSAHEVETRSISPYYFTAYPGDSSATVKYPITTKRLAHAG